jgi:lipopolysaccharide cholinephosphotransferase
MAIFNKIKQKNPNNNESDKKDNEDSNKKINKKLKKLNKRISDLEEKNKYYERVIESDNFLFNTLFVNYDLKPKGILKDMQDLCQELLDLTTNICNKHDIDYWLDGGNLLGAIRHGGFIPWDDDMDIAMMRKDYNKFSQIVDDEIALLGLDDVILVQKDQTVRENFINPFIKLDYMHGDNVISGIDVFPFDFTDNHEITEKDHRIERDKFFKKMCSGQSRSEVIDEYYSNLKLKWDEGDYIIPGIETPRYSAGYKNIIYLWDTSKMLPLKQVEFNGKYYNSPKDQDYYLSTTYSDYMKVPRVVNHNHTNVADIQEVDGVNAVYQEAIERLRRINEGF